MTCGAPRPRPGHRGRARESAVDPARNVVLEASAGTGKTQRPRDALHQPAAGGRRSGEHPGHHVHAEGRRGDARSHPRDLRALAGQSAEDEARWASLRDRLADISISTIDAFCFALLREFPLEADLDPGFDIADETAVPRLTDEAIDGALGAARRLASRGGVASQHRGRRCARPARRDDREYRAIFEEGARRRVGRSVGRMPAGLPTARIDRGHRVADVDARRAAGPARPRGADRPAARRRTRRFAGSWPKPSARRRPRRLPGWSRACRASSRRSTAASRRSSRTGRLERSLRSDCGRPPRGRRGLRIRWTWRGRSAAPPADRARGRRARVALLPERRRHAAGQAGAALPEAPLPRRGRVGPSRGRDGRRRAALADAMAEFERHLNVALVRAMSRLFRIARRLYRRRSRPRRPWTSPKGWLETLRLLGRWTSSRAAGTGWRPGTTTCWWTSSRTRTRRSGA